MHNPPTKTIIYQACKTSVSTRTVLEAHMLVIFIVTLDAAARGYRYFSKFDPKI